MHNHNHMLRAVGGIGDRPQSIIAARRTATSSSTCLQHPFARLTSPQSPCKAISALQSHHPYSQTILTYPPEHVKRQRSTTTTATTTTTTTSKHLRHTTVPPDHNPHAPQVQCRRAEEMRGLPYPLPALPRSMLQQRPLTSFPFPAPFPLWLNTCYFASQSPSTRPISEHVPHGLYLRRLCLSLLSHREYMTCHARLPDPCPRIYVGPPAVTERKCERATCRDSILGLSCVGLVGR